MRIYNSLKARVSTGKFSDQVHLSPEAPALVGFTCGNETHSGCLTCDENVRLHSCEKGNYCSTVRKGPVVWIQPVVAHLDGEVDLLELGVGGGADDLQREAELEYLNTDEIGALIQV
jgi:DNA cross-link repair 1C protein